MSETVTIPRGLLEALTHYAVYLADSSLEIAKNNVRLEGAIVGAQALLSAPQEPELERLRAAIREHREACMPLLDDWRNRKLWAELE